MIFIEMSTYLLSLLEEDKISLCRRAYILYHKLYGIEIAGMLGLLDSVADVDRLMSVNMLEIWCHVEGYCIDHTACAIVFKLQFYVFEIFPYELTRTEIENVACAEHRVLVARTERIKLLEMCHKLRRDIGELNHRVNLDHRGQLVGLDMSSHVFFKPATELFDVFLF